MVPRKIKNKWSEIVEAVPPRWIAATIVGIFTISGTIRSNVKVDQQDHDITEIVASGDSLTFSVDSLAVEVLKIKRELEEVKKLAQSGKRTIIYRTGTPPKEKGPVSKLWGVFKGLFHVPKEDRPTERG